MSTSEADHRRANRTNVLLSAMLETSTGSSCSVRVANLSSTGALVFGDSLPLQNELITLICGPKKAIPGRVAWVGSQHAGLAFDYAIAPGDVLPKRTATATLIVKDQRKLDFRRPGFRGNQLTADEQALLAEWKLCIMSQPT